MVIYMKSAASFIRNQVIANIIINFTLAYYLSKHALEGMSVIPYEAPVNDMFHPNMAGDLLVGTFIMGVVLTFVMTALTRLQTNNGAINLDNIKQPSKITFLPNPLLFRALVVGFLAAMVLAFPVAAILDVLKVHSMPSGSYILYHAVYCAAASALVCIVVCQRALIDSPRHSEHRALE